MQVKDINTGNIKGYAICNEKYKISFLGGPTTSTYSIWLNIQEHFITIIASLTK